MKQRTMMLLAGAGGAMICNCGAQAAFIGLHIQFADSFFSNHPNTAVRDAWNAGPVHEYNVYRFYALFTSNTPADRVNGVGGSPHHPLMMNATFDTFYNYTEEDHHTTYHFNLPSGTAPPQRAWDTYVTIGNAIDGGTTQLSPGFASETNNLGYQSNSFSAINAGWVISSSDPQGQAVASAPGQSNAPAGSYWVLLGQFTTTQAGAPLFYGSFGIIVNGELVNVSFIIEPSPGALPLFTAAALICKRRRR